MRYSVAWLAVIASAMLCSQSGAADLLTVAEQSAFKRTGRYDEVVRLCAAYQQAWPNQARCFEFGRTPEGRAMLALAVSADGVLDAQSAVKAARPVVLVQGGIHAGEIDGKDAGFWVLRDLLEGRVAKNALSKITLVFVPIFNIDGHERFGRNNRPNQIGPEEMGWRTTAQNLNLNRDYVKAEAPEMQAMLRLLNEWDPMVYADLHVTDGAEFEHDISIDVAPTLAGDTDLKAAGMQLRDAIMSALNASGSLPLNFYPSFVRDDDPTSGIAINVAPPRFSQEYWALHNRIGVLVETHSWKDYKTRVRSTYHAMVALTESAAVNGKAWRATQRAVDQRAQTLGGSNVVLSYENTDHTTPFDFHGYRYTRTPSSISGDLMTQYDNTQPQIWRIPLYDQLRPATVVIAPRGGYVIPAAYAELAATKLLLHGLEFKTMTMPLTKLDVEAFRATTAQTSATTFEGRSALQVQGAWQAEARAIPAGSLYVPIAQAKAQLLMALLEPKSDDSLLAWGFFNGAFERKEYMEAYVAEQVAQDMLKKDPTLKAEFERKLNGDPEFAKSAQARLDFFYRRHASWDERFNLYPVYRVERDPLKLSN